MKRKIVIKRKTLDKLEKAITIILYLAFGVYVWYAFFNAL